MNSDSSKQKSTRKVAILIRLVNEELADFLLSKMPPEDEAAVRQMTVALEDIRPDEQEEVIEDFLQQTGWAREDVLGAPESMGEDDGGVELQWSASVKTTVEAENHNPQPWEVADADPDPEYEPTQVGRCPLGFVGPESASMVVRMIQNESGSMGAVILSLLEPVVAARVLEHFNDSTRLQLLRLLSELGETHPEVIAEIVTQVRKELDASHPPVMTAGMQAVQRILETSGWTSDPPFWNQLDVVRAEQVDRESVVAFKLNPSGPTDSSSLANETATQVVGPLKVFRGPEWFPSVQEKKGLDDEAGLIQGTQSVVSKPADVPDVESVSGNVPNRFEENRLSIERGQQREEEVLSRSQLIQQQFDRLVDWPAKSLLQIFKNVPPKVMMMAMTGAQSGMLAKMKKVLSRQQALRLEREIERTGPIRLADIHKAQQAVLGLIEDLQEQGKVDIPKRLAVEA